MHVLNILCILDIVVESHGDGGMKRIVEGERESKMQRKRERERERERGS